MSFIDVVEPMKFPEMMPLIEIYSRQIFGKFSVNFQIYTCEGNIFKMKTV